MRVRFTHQAVLGIVLICQFSVCLGTEIPNTNQSTKYLDAVREFADNVLKYGRDTYEPKHTPLFVDGLNIHTHEPVKWIAPNGDRWILSNLASQQNLFRALDGLTRITGDPKYKQAAMAAIKYAFENLRSPNGLLYWGGHIAYDVGDEKVCARGPSNNHELKNHFPYYELMWHVDPKATQQFIESFWSAHILDWSNLDMNRHGHTEMTLGTPWGNEYKGGSAFFWGRGLTFINTGSDLFYAAAVLSHLSSEKQPLVWAKRLAYRYVETRNPKTGIGGYQYSQCKTAWCCGPSIQGDRAQYQFGDDFKDHFVVEGTLFPCYGSTPAVQPRICEFLLGEMLGVQGKQFTQWALEELDAWGRVAYRKEDNSFIPMLTDGTSMEGYVCKKDGYFGPKGRVLKAGRAGPLDFWAYVLAYRITGEVFMRQMACNIAQGNGFGDIGRDPQAAPHLDMDTDCSSAYALLGFLELYKNKKNTAFLEMAQKIGDNILAERFHKGFFVASKRHIYARFDDLEPLSLLHLDAAVQARSSPIPWVWPSSSFLACEYYGRDTAYDTSLIYTLTDSAEPPMTPQVAAVVGDLDKLKTLLSKESSTTVDKYTTLNNTFLLAAQSGHTHVVEFLLAEGAEINSGTTTALHYAVQNGHRDVIELLLVKGADVNAKDGAQQAPIEIAMSQNRKNIVELLIQKGADISLHTAARYGLLEKLQVLIAKGTDVNAADSSGQKALHYAAEIGRKDIAELLIAKGADVNAKNDDGQPALHIAIQRNRTEIVKLLIESGADVNDKNNEGQTPVDVAASRNRSEVVKLLIEKGVDVSSIHLAAYLGDAAKVMNFIEQGSDVNTKDEQGLTPLHYAATAGSKEVSKLLLARGADIEAKDKNGATPLHRGSAAGHRDLAELLITKGADIDTRDDTWGETPLHWVVSAGHRDVAELLIVKGADVNAKEKDGKTPLQVAKDKGHAEIIELLRKHAANLVSNSETRRDVAITGVSALSRGLRDYTVPVVVNIENQGDCGESFDVKLIDVTDGLIIGSKTVTLSASGASGMDEVVDRIFDAEEDAENFFGQMVRIGGDANGDGYRDLLVSARDWNNTQGRSYLYYGRKGMMDENADKTFTGEGIGDRFSNQSGAFGDVNGDGFDDVIIGAQGYPNGDNTGRVYIFYGGPNIDNNADVILDGEAGETGWFGLIVAAGDANNDGYDDVLVTALAMNSWKGRAYLYYGGNPMDTTADKVFDGENAGDLYGRDAFMGDVDGDSCADVLIGARRWPEGTNRGRAYLYYGGLGTSMDTVCDLTFTGENVGDFFGHALGIIDVDNDNFGDILIGAYGYPAGGNEGRAYLYWGSSRATFDNVADKTFDGEPHPANARFGVESGVGYANGDDYGDLLIGAYEYYNWDKRGRVYLFYGDKKGSMDTICDHTFTGSDLTSRYGVEAELGDLNKDGFAEVVIGGWSYPYGTNRGRVWLYYGSHGGSTQLKFDWDTTNASPGKHLLKATIDPIAGEKDIEDNTITVTVEVKEPSK